MRRVNVARRQCMLAVLLTGVLIAGCGSSKTSPTSSSTSAGASVSTSGGASSTTKSSSADVKYAVGQVKKAVALPAYTPPGTPISIASLRGKSVLLIPDTTEIQFCTTVDDQMVKVGAQDGVKVSIYSTQGLPSQWAQGIQQGISQKVSAIVLECGLDSAQVAPQIKAAHAAGIPVIDADDNDPSVPVGHGITVNYAVPLYHAYSVLADEVIANLAGKTPNVLVVTANGTTSAVGSVKAFQQEMSSRCGPACKVKVVNVPIPEWSTKIQTTVSSELTANPGTNAVVALYDGMVPFVSPAIQAAHASGNPKIYTYGGATAILKLIKPQSNLAGDVGLSTGALAYGGMNLVYRVLTHSKLTDNQLATPLRLFVPSDVSQAFDSTQGFGDSYVNAYRKLWGLG